MIAFSYRFDIAIDPFVASTEIIVIIRYRGRSIYYNGSSSVADIAQLNLLQCLFIRCRHRSINYNVTPDRNTIVRIAYRHRQLKRQCRCRC